MADQLDVLVVESHRGRSTRQTAALERSGHRIHRCHDPGSSGFPCVAITDPGSCPIERGIDVALVVRRVSARATDLEHGVSCSLRAGVPVVEDGPTVLDPFESYLTGRVTGDVVAACEEAADSGYDGLRESIAVRTRRVLTNAGIDPSELSCRFERSGTGLRIEISGPPASKTVVGSVAIRVLDAVGASGRSYDRVDVTYAPIEPATASSAEQ